MKKKLLTFVLIFLCAVVCFSGCGLGSFIDVGNNGSSPTKPVDPDDPVVDPDNPDNPDNPEEPGISEDDYTVTVYYNNKIFSPDNLEIYVVWRNSYEVKRVLLGGNGKANAGELDGTYNVYLEGLPDKYVYDPNVNVASVEERKLTILLTDVRSPEEGDGSGLYRSQGCYLVRYDGFYRANVKREGQLVYYEYSPTEEGAYEIESFVNLYADEVCPSVLLYVGTVGWKKIDTTQNVQWNSLKGGFTKNFKIVFNVDKQFVGNCLTFAVGASCKSIDSYPAYVDFKITYKGEYVDPNSDIREVPVGDAFNFLTPPVADGPFVWADLGTKKFNSENYKLNPNTGVYHRYSEELYGTNPYGFGRGYGPMLCCAIKTTIPCYKVAGFTTLYAADYVMPPGAYRATNYLKLYNSWIEEEQKFAVLDYTSFIKDYYATKCNSAGYCYVTPELQDFLQRFAASWSLWTDNDAEYMAAGTPETNGYTTDKDGYYLFACGYYAGQQ